MSNLIGAYKEYIILERESLNEFETKAKALLSAGQDEHNVGDIRRAKVMLECIEWIKENNIYTKEFEIKS